ncbi:MAG: hypothetical protein J6C41_08460 [Oscillospiraceae bacterium]|nr:hypothetical protein [Oscillospiraceae bacterium]
MSNIGYIQVHAYTAKAQLPLRNVAIAVTNDQGKTIALRMTNSSGKIDRPVEIQVPIPAAGLSPNTGIVPYSTVNLYAKVADYEEIEANNIQVFPGIITVQDLQMIPLSELPQYQNQVEIFNTPAQNL